MYFRPWKLCSTRVTVESKKERYRFWVVIRSLSKLSLSSNHSHFHIIKIPANKPFSSPSVVKALSLPSSSVLISGLPHLYDPSDDLFIGLGLIIGLVLRLLSTTVRVDQLRGVPGVSASHSYVRPINLLQSWVCVSMSAVSLYSFIHQS